HRVKNNLQIISSLLMLQAEKLSNAADKTVFDECRDRIYSMARLHERLYSSGEFSDLDFAAHLREMAEMLVRSHTPQGCTLVLDVELVLGMTRQIRGEAKIENDPGGGTRTTIFFPSLLSSEIAKTEPQSKPTYHD